MTDLRELTASVHTVVPILGAMGIEVAEAERGRVAARLPAEPNVNHFGVAYAGSLFSVAEMLGGLVAMTSFPLEGFVPLVKRLDISFLRPATTAVLATTSLSDDEIARVLTEAPEHGKAEFVLTTELTDDAGQVVASTRGDYQLRRM